MPRKPRSTVRGGPGGAAAMLSQVVRAPSPTGRSGRTRVRLPVVQVGVWGRAGRRNDAAPGLPARPGRTCSSWTVAAATGARSSLYTVGPAQTLRAVPGAPMGSKAPFPVHQLR